MVRWLETLQCGLWLTSHSRALEDDFGGTVDVSYEATGLVCRLTAPLENLVTSPKA